MVALLEPPKVQLCSGRKRDGSKCQGIVRFTATTLCEDCWALTQWIMPGRPQRVRLERVNYDDES